MARTYDHVFIVGSGWSKLRVVLWAMYTVDYTHFVADKDYYYKGEEGNGKENGSGNGNGNGNGLIFVVFVLNGGLGFVAAFVFVVRKLIFSAFLLYPWIFSWMFSVRKQQELLYDREEVMN